MNRNDLKGLARARLRESRALLESGEYSGAYYLAGYVVECALKACIAKQTLRHDFPNKERANTSWSHSLIGLIQVAGLQTALDAERKADPQFDANWGVVKDWKTDTRYASKDQTQAEGLVRAISDNRHGVLDG
jgi:hypothetical protein